MTTSHVVLLLNVCWVRQHSVRTHRAQVLQERREKFNFSIDKQQSNLCGQKRVHELNTVRSVCVEKFNF